MTLDDLWGHTSLGLKQKVYRRKKWFIILRWPYVTFNGLWGHTFFMKCFRLHYVSIHINFHWNRFLNECSTKNLSNSRNFRKTEFFTFLKICLINNAKKISIYNIIYIIPTYSLLTRLTWHLCFTNPRSSTCQCSLSTRRKSCQSQWVS